MQNNIFKSSEIYPAIPLDDITNDKESSKLQDIPQQIEELGESNNSSKNDELFLQMPNMEKISIPNAILPNGDYYTVIERRGRYYNYKQNNPDDNPYSLHSTQDMARDLYREAYQLAGKSNFRAKIFKYCHIIISIIVIVGNIAIAIASIHSKMNGREYAVAVVSIIIAAFESLRHIVKFNTRGIALKRVAGQMRSIARHVNQLLMENLSSDKLYKKIEHYYHLLDRYDLQIYDNSLGKISVKNNTNITYSSVSGYSDIKSKKSKKHKKPKN